MSVWDTLLGLYDYVRPVLDIALLTYLLYKAYGILLKTQGMQIVRSAIVLALSYVVALVFDLQTIKWLLNLVASGLIICFAIVFQPELRKIFLKIGQGDWFKLGNRAKDTYIDSVLIAAEMLSNQRRGMLAVFMRRNSLKDIIDTGTKLNAELSSSLLVTIFGHDTPLHDGAVIIQGNKLVSAGCFLPLSEQYDIKKTFGTRHRAALGLSEQTDAIILVVSEETGAITLAYDSKLFYDLNMEQLTHTLEMELDIPTEEIKPEDNANEKASAR